MNTPAKIDELINDSGLELTTAQEIKGGYLPFLEKIHQTIEEAQTINKESPTKEDEALARSLRLGLVPNRTQAHKFKMARTEKLRLVKNLEDASYRLIENESKLVENELKEIEEFQANKIKAQQEALKLERNEIALKYIDNPDFYPFATMTQEQFDRFIEDQKLAQQAREKIENERIAKEEAERLKAIEEQKKKDAEAKRLAEENAKLKAEADEKAKAEEEAKKKAEEEKKAKIKIENERVNKMMEALIENKWQKDETGFSKEGYYIKTAALKEHSPSTLEAFMKLANKEIEEERKQKEAEKLKESPDKEQLKQWIENLTIPEVNLKSEQGVKAYAEIRIKFEGFKGWALTLTEEL